jgi:hypothetical protein
LSKAIETQLESLANACTAATFGADNKGVLDLSYRRDGKMDVADFISCFDPELLGLSEFVRGQDGDLDGTPYYSPWRSHHSMKERILSSRHTKIRLAVWT